MHGGGEGSQEIIMESSRGFGLTRPGGDRMRRSNRFDESRREYLEISKQIVAPRESLGNLGGVLGQRA